MEWLLTPFRVSEFLFSEFFFLCLFFYSVFCILFSVRWSGVKSFLIITSLNSGDAFSGMNLALSIKNQFYFSV